MKKHRLTLGAIAAAMILFCSLSFNVRAASDSKGELTDIEHKALAASTADELTAFYDPNDIITYDYISPLQYVGATAVHTDVDKFFSKTKDLKGNFVDLQVETDGRMGVAHSLQHFTWMDKNGKQQEAIFRVTNCYHKVNGEWKIFHMHTSFPIDPSTSKVEMNLKE